MATMSSQLLPSTTSMAASSSAVRNIALAVGDQTLKGVGNLIKLLPSGTVFLFQFLNPLLTNNGHCTALNKALAGVLLAVCGLSCCFSCFTDSYRGADGRLYYGIVTAGGLLPFWDPSAASTDFSKYKLRFSDFVHAALSLLVFAVVSLLDTNTVSCYYPALAAAQKVLLMVLPAVVGAVASATFVLFPSNRHGIGYPPAASKDGGSSTTTTSSSSSTTTTT